MKAGAKSNKRGAEEEDGVAKKKAAAAPLEMDKYDAKAIQELFPKCKVAVGPVTREGPGEPLSFCPAKGASASDKSSVAKFKPNRTPEEVLRAGSFGGTYFRTIDSGVVKETLKDQWRELPASWISGLNPSTHLARPWKRYDEGINKFRKKSGTSLEDWESSGWITAHDPFGWFQWYCRFYQGRRCEDDNRQIGRWLKCCGPTGRWKGNLCGKVAVAHAAFDDPKVSPVVRQTLLHWGYELTRGDFEIALKKLGKGSGAYGMNKDQINAAVSTSTQAAAAAPPPPPPSKQPRAAPKPRGDVGIDEKLREKVKTALRGKAVEESKVAAVETALFKAAASDKNRFKELTRLFAAELTGSPASLASLNNGTVKPADLVARAAQHTAGL